MWISEPTPVTTSIITSDKGSISSEHGTRKAPTRIQSIGSCRLTSTGRPSAPRATPAGTVRWGFT